MLRSLGIVQGRQYGTIPKLALLVRFAVDG
jgi:hypothetical protein